MNLQRALGIGCLFAAAIAIAAEPDGGKVHYDGAKDEPCEIIIYGIGPATSTRVGGQ